MRRKELTSKIIECAYCVQGPQLKDLENGNVDRARSVLAWAMAHMWDKRGYFYYQVHPRYAIRIPYMRWSHAWMLLALATLLEHEAQL